VPKRPLDQVRTNNAFQKGFPEDFAPRLGHPSVRFFVTKPQLSHPRGTYLRL
jgi:hypothetical protein